MRYFQHPAIPNLLITLTSIICVGIYWEGLYGPLLLDDMSVLGPILDPEFSQKDILANLFSTTGILQRPVSMMSFIINGLFGSDLFYWKLTNLTIHLFCGILIYFIAARLFRFVNSANSNTENNFIAAIVAAAWILHPLQVSTVLYTVQRMTQLSTLFVFAAMLSYIIARERQLKGLSSWPLQVITWLVLFPLGLFSKENALLFPAFIALLEVFVYSRDKINNQNLLKAIFFASLVLIVILMFMGDWILGGYTVRGFTLPERLYSEGRILIAYIGMLLIPAQSRMGFVHDDFSISHSLLEPWTTLPSILIIISLITAAFYLRKKHPLIGFGILFFFIGHAIESTFLALELMFEHRNYLPSFGLLFAVVVATNEIIKNRQIVTIFSVAFFSLLIFSTSVRTDTWSSGIGIHYYMEITHPRSERLATITATQYENAGLFPNARKRLEGFTSTGAEIQRLNIDCSEHKQLTNKQLSIDTNQWELVNNYTILQLTDLANRGLDKECVFSSDLFLSLLNRVNKLHSISNNNRQIVSMYRAHYFWELNRQEKALEVLHKTFTLDRNNPTPLFLACEWMLDTDRTIESEKTCNAALNAASRVPFNKYKNLANKIKGRLKQSSENSN